MSERERLITLPPDTDDSTRALLSEKLRQYEEWAGSEGRQYRPPEVRNKQRDYAKIGLRRLLDTGEFDTYQLSLELCDSQRGGFSLDDFERGMAVVDTYSSDTEFLEERVIACRT